MLMKHIQEAGGNILARRRVRCCDQAHVVAPFFREIWENRDYYGYNIQGTRTPLGNKQNMATISHMFGDTTPISVSQRPACARHRRHLVRRRAACPRPAFGPAAEYAKRLRPRTGLRSLVRDTFAPASRLGGGETSRRPNAPRTQFANRDHTRRKAVGEPRAMMRPTVKTLSRFCR